MKNGPEGIAKMYNEIQNETKQTETKINLLQNRSEQFKKKTNVIGKKTRANRKNAESLTK